MTREEAIAVLGTAKYELSNQVASKYCRAKYEAINMAIKALEQESILDNCIEIPEGATNGDILKAIFNIKDEQITEHNLFISVSEFDCSKDNFCNPHDFFKTWWNAPYKKGDKE